jgi:bifunctional DNase/RNase
VAEEPPRLAEERMRIAVLKEQDGARRLPIWIGPAEGDALTLLLRGETVPRPLTVDLTVSLLAAVGARIERVVVSKLEERTFFAVVAVQAGGETREVDARPSDALNLAMRSGSPIFVDETLMEEAKTRPACSIRRR